MQKIALIGGFDKTDLILYMAKILSILKKKVLFIDSTLTAKSRYIVPTMTPAQKYVSTFDGIDVAIGFANMKEINEYLSTTSRGEYDIVLFDVDNPVHYINFGFGPGDQHYIITTFDVYSVSRAINVFRAFREPTKVTKVLFTKDTESRESEYLDFVSQNYKVEWEKNIIFFPFDTEDLYQIYQNQRNARVKLSGLSMDYIDSLSYFVESATGLSHGDVKKAMKMIEREG